MALSSSVSGGALSSLLNAYSGNSSLSAETCTVRRVSLAANAAHGSARQANETPVQKNSWDWPLPCPQVNSEEPEGPVDDDCCDVTNAPVTLGSAGCDPSVPLSTKGQTPSRGVEVRVGVARATRFTPEKARLLRKQTRESESHHDFMYHAGLASHLA